MKIKKDLYFNDLHYLTKRTYDLFYDEANKKSYKYLKKYINKAIFCEQGWWNISLNKMQSSQSFIKDFINNTTQCPFYPK